jgi:hypothetical protein
MTIEQAVQNKLLATSALTALVSTRIYYAVKPQTPTYPCISFFKVSNFRHHDIDVASPRFQFDVWSLSYIQAVQVANEIRLALQRERAVMSTIEVIQGVYLNEIDLYEPDTKLHHIALDMKILYRGD